jgi:hypothetical protein
MSKYCIWCGGKYFGKQNQDLRQELLERAEAHELWQARAQKCAQQLDDLGFMPSWVIDEEEEDEQ